MLTKGTQPKRTQNDIARQRLVNQWTRNNHGRKALIRSLYLSEVDATGSATWPRTPFQQQGFTGADLERFV